MKTRILHNYWVSTWRFNDIWRRYFLLKRLRLPIVSRSIPFLRGGRNKQWQKAMEITYRSWMQKHENQLFSHWLFWGPDNWNGFDTDGMVMANDHGNEMDQD